VVIVVGCMLLKNTSLLEGLELLALRLVIVMKNDIRMKMIMIVCCFEKFM
jgi:hypothetical protein